MSKEHTMDNERDQRLRMECIDMATRVVGKPVYYVDINNQQQKHHDDVVEVATKIYEFVKGE